MEAKVHLHVMAPGQHFVFIQRQAAAWIIFIYYEDNIGIRQLLPVSAFFQQCGVHHRSMVPHPPWAESLFSVLDLHIEAPAGVILSQDIQPKTAVDTVFQQFLHLDGNHTQTGHLQDDPQDQLNRRNVLQCYPGEQIVDQAIVQHGKFRFVPDGIQIRVEGMIPGPVRPFPLFLQTLCKIPVYVQPAGCFCVLAGLFFIHTKNLLLYRFARRPCF